MGYSDKRLKRITLVSRRLIPADLHFEDGFFQDGVLCSLVNTDRRFRGPYCLSILTMEPVISSETSASVYRTTLFLIPEDNHLHTRYSDNLISERDSTLRNATTVSSKVFPTKFDNKIRLKEEPLRAARISHSTKHSKIMRQTVIAFIIIIIIIIIITTITTFFFSTARHRQFACSAFTIS
jgi:hypothetical protein